MDKNRETAHLSIPIPLELHFKLQKLLPHGLKTPLFRSLAEDIVKILEHATQKRRDMIFGAIAAKKLTVEGISPIFKKRKK